MPVLIIGAVDLVALLIALAALLVLGALWVFARPIELVLSHVPVIGGYMEGAFTNGLEAAMQAVASGMDSLTYGVAHLFWALSVGMWHLVEQIVNGIQDAKNAAVAAAGAVGALAVSVGADIAFAAAVTLNAANAAVEYLRQEAVGLFNSVEADLAFVAAVVTAGYNAAVEYLRSEVLGFVGALGLDIASAVVTAEDFATAAADDVLSEAVRLFGQAEADIGFVGDVAGALINGLEGDIAGIEGELAPLLGALPLIGAIPGLLSGVAAITTEVDECLAPLCDTVTPNASQLGNLGKFLQGLEALGLDVAVAALFTEAVADPAGLARDVTTVMEDVGGPVVAGVRTLTSL